MASSTPPLFDGELISIESVDWDTKNFASVATYLSIEVGGKHCLMFGKNAKYGNLSAFGGLPEEGETLFQTCHREFNEETLNAFTPRLEGDLCKEELTRIWQRPGNRYVFHTFVPNDYDCFDIIRKRFHEYMETFKDNLTPGERENNDLVVLSLEDIKKSASSNIDINNWLVSSFDGTSKYKLRNVCVATSLMLANE